MQQKIIIPTTETIPSSTVLETTSHLLSDHPYITSAKKLGGWGQKSQFLLMFSTIQWVGQKKSKNLPT